MHAQPPPAAIPTLPPLDNLRAVLAMSQNPIGLYPFFVRYGDAFYMHFGRHKMLALADPHLIKHVLATHNRNYIKGPGTRKLRDVLGVGLLTADGEYWLRQRRLIQPAFHRQRLAALVGIMAAEVMAYADTLAPKLGTTVDIHREMGQLTLQVVGKSLFSTGISPQQVQRMGQAVSLLQEFFIIRFVQPLRNWWLTRTGGIRTYLEAAVHLDELIYGIIRAREAQGPGGGDLLDMLIQAQDADTGERLTEEQLRNETAVLFLAGHETSAGALSYLWYLLAHHPEVEQRVLDEVRRVAGQGPVSMAHLPQLAYTKQVLDETMRLYPPAWGTGRQAIEPDAFEGKASLAAGESAHVAIYAMHRNPRWWPQPHAFDPDRFAPDRATAQHPYAYLPFGGGPRLCIGSSFAMYEMQLAVAELIRRYRFVWQGGPLHLKARVTLLPTAPMHMKVLAREA